jgi:hypothetical protein
MLKDTGSVSRKVNLERILGIMKYQTALVGVQGSYVFSNIK